MIKNPFNNLLLPFLIFLFLNSAYFPQVADSTDYSEYYPFIVDSIAVNGNKITERFIITRELTFSVGDTVDEKTVFYNRERIYSLGIFNRVTLKPQIADGKNILKIDVEESWYIYPMPFIDAKENDIKKLSYGLYLRIKNFRGRNEELSGSFALGYDPSFSLNYYNPDIIDRKDIFFRTKILYADITNKSPSAELLNGENFSQKFSNIQLIIGKRFGLFHRLYLSSSYNYIETPFYIPKVNASNNRIDNRIDFGVGYEFDSRDLVQFPTNGIYSNISYTQKGFGVDEINYSVAWLDFREYRKLFDDLNAKWRIASRFTFGKNVPFYDQSILGVDDKIRGHFNQKMEGDNYYFGGIEMSYPIIKEMNIDLTFIPIVPDALLSYRIGFYIQTFIETGAAQIKNVPLKFSDFKSGYGAGLTLLILPYNILRVDFALNEYKKMEIILNLGISY